MSSPTAAAPEAERLSDEALLARFQSPRSRPKGTETLGFEIVALNQDEGFVEARFVASEAFANPMGQVQGGFVCAFLDEIMAVAGIVKLGLGHVMPTLEMKTSFLRPTMADGGSLRGVGRVVRLGKTVAFLEGELFDAQGRLLAKASATALPTPLARFQTPG